MVPELIARQRRPVILKASLVEGASIDEDISDLALGDVPVYVALVGCSTLVRISRTGASCSLWLMAISGLLYRSSASSGGVAGAADC